MKKICRLSHEDKVPPKYQQAKGGFRNQGTDMNISIVILPGLNQRGRLICWVDIRGKDDSPVYR